MKFTCNQQILAKAITLIKQYQQNNLPILKVFCFGNSNRVTDTDSIGSGNKLKKEIEHRRRTGKRSCNIQLFGDIVRKLRMNKISVSGDD